MTFTQIRERCRTQIDAAMALKLSLEEGYDRVVIQTSINQAYAAIRASSIPDMQAMTEKLRSVRQFYTPKKEVA